MIAMTTGITKHLICCTPRKAYDLVIRGKMKERRKYKKEDREKKGRKFDVSSKLTI